MLTCKKSANWKAIGVGNVDLDGMFKWRIWGGAGSLHLAKQSMLLLA